jgi:hypothetical protein
MAVPARLEELVAQLPDPDGRGMYTENIDKERIERVVAAIHQGGRPFVLGLVAMLDEPGTPANVKPHYALHCLTNHVLVVKDERGRQTLVEVLCEQLGSDRVSTANKRYLCEQLQWAGGREACGTLGRLLADEQLVEPAAMALVAIRDGAAEQFRAALPNARGKCRLNVVHGLAAVADASSAAALRETLRDEDREVRIAAGRGLARLGDESAVEPLGAAADAADGWERIQHTHSYLQLAERLAAAGNAAAATTIYTHLRDTRNDPSEQYLREAAERALAAG